MSRSYLDAAENATSPSLGSLPHPITTASAHSNRVVLLLLALHRIHSELLWNGEAVALQSRHEMAANPGLERLEPMFSHEHARAQSRDEALATIRSHTSREVAQEAGFAIALLVAERGELLEHEIPASDLVDELRADVD